VKNDIVKESYLLGNGSLFVFVAEEDIMQPCVDLSPREAIIISHIFVRHRSLRHFSIVIIRLKDLLGAPTFRDSK